MSQTYPAVIAYQDGKDSKVAADYLNRPINQLKARTDYLKRVLDNLIGANAYESIRGQRIALSTEDPPIPYNVVAFDPDKNVFVKALAEGTTFPVERYAYGLPESYAVGILVAVDGNYGTVVTYGNCTELIGKPIAGLIQSDETFRNGPYYVSASEPGRMTARPTGMAVYMGIFMEDSNNPGYFGAVWLTPTIKDLWESHLHMDFVLGGIPAGSVMNEIVGSQQVLRVYGYLPDAFDSAKQPSSDFIGADVPVRLKLTGSWLATADTNVIFTLTSVDGTLDNAVLAWEFTDGSSVGTVAVNDYEYAFDLPGTGMQVILETGDIYASWDPDTKFNKLGRIVTAPALDTSSSNIGDPVYYHTGAYQLSGTAAQQIGTVYSIASSNAKVMLGGFTGVSYSWTLSMPDEAAGWIQKYVREQGAYAGTNTDYDYTVLLYGIFTNEAKLGIQDISFRVTAGTSFDPASGGVTVDVTRNDPSGPVVLQSFTGVVFDKPLVFADGSGDYNLCFYFTNRTPGGISNGHNEAAVGDQWDFELPDEKPGFAYEYNIGYDVRLAPYYPPIPMTAMVLDNNGNGVLLDEDFPEEEYVWGWNARTVFWSSDVNVHCPFPEDWHGWGQPYAAEPRNFKLYSSNMRLSAVGLVNTLKPAEGSGIEIVDRKTGKPAVHGDLELRSSYKNSVVDVDLTGYQVIKSVRSDGAFMRGPVVEKLYAGPGVILTNTNPADPTGQGGVQISAGAAGLQQGDFTDVTLLNAKQELVPGRMISFIKLLKWTNGSAGNIPSGFIAKFRVPYSLTSTYRVLFYFTMFGLDDVQGTPMTVEYCGLKLTYSVMQDYSKPPAPTTPEGIYRNLRDSGSGGILETEMPLDVYFGAPAPAGPGDTDGYRAWDPFLYHNDPAMAEVPGQVQPFISSDPDFVTPIPIPNDTLPTPDDPATVTSGDIVAVKVERADTSHATEYSGEIGFVDMKWKLLDLTP